MKDRAVETSEGQRDEIASSTDMSLLGRLRVNSPEAWGRFVTLYGPLVYTWCRRSGVSPDDAPDLLQDVFRTVAASLDRFRHDRPGDTFRGWLWTITRSRITDHWRRRGAQPRATGGTEALGRLSQLPAENSDDSATFVGLGDNRRLLQRALDTIRSEFETRSWRAFWRTTMDGERAAAVAGDFAITSNAVYIARSRVLRRLREELDGLFEYGTKEGDES